ncbi:hypothetical protein ZWY2020_008876 [Hordeum vulgare]|nr:hypothetical protein ZWY2020_008876 [Hordeum vulgare]
MAPLAIASCSILLLVPCAQGQGQGQPPEAPEEGQPPEASEDALTMRLSEGGCGAFAGLVAATAGVGEAFHKQIGSDLGLTILCPDDQAVAAFIPRLNDLTVDEQGVVLLYHGLTMAYSQELLRLVKLEVSTLDGEQMLTIRHHGGRVIVSSSPPSSRNEARITASVDMYAEYPLTGQDWILVYTSPPLSCSVSKPKLVQHHFVVLYQNLEPRSGFTQKYNRRRGRLPAGLETTQYLWNPLSSNA